MRGSAVGQADIRIAARAEQRAESKRIMLASESLAIGAAFCLALGSMISAELKGRISIITLTLWQTATAALLLLALASFTGGWSTIRAWHVPYICASGLFGTVLANASFVGAIFIAGPRRAVLLFSLMRPLRSCSDSSCSERRSARFRLSALLLSFSVSPWPSCLAGFRQSGLGAAEAMPPFPPPSLALASVFYWASVQPCFRRSQI